MCYSTRDTIHSPYVSTYTVSGTKTYPVRLTPLVRPCTYRLVTLKSRYLIYTWTFSGNLSVKSVDSHLSPLRRSSITEDWTQISTFLYSFFHTQDHLRCHTYEWVRIYCQWNLLIERGEVISRESVMKYVIVYLLIYLLNDYGTTFIHQFCLRKTCTALHFISDRH